MSIEITEEMKQYEDCRIEITSFFVSLIKKYPKLTLIDRATIASEVVYSQLKVIRRYQNE